MIKYTYWAKMDGLLEKHPHHLQEKDTAEKKSLKWYCMYE